ncbi:MAG: IS1634 family transposase [Candidatus Aminicenantes bacterium]|nr:IS1634 family transposase [Candidatus Aminicenantes bacterium]
MYVRKVSHYNKSNRVEYHTYKLVESVRTERGPRQRTLLNLGTDFNLSQGKWKEFANRVEDIITGQIPLLDYPEEIENFAQNCARKIIRKQSSIIPEKKDSDYLPDYQTVDVNSTENEQARTIGAEHVVYHTIKELELDRKLAELKFNKPHLEAAIGVIAARLINPASERKTHIWLKEISGIDELMDTDFSKLSQDRVYKVSDMLLKGKKNIEEHLSFKERNLFNLEEKIILYDLTNTFLEGTGKYNKKAHFARSKEKRSDCPLVTLGLVLDAEGFPKRSNVFDGNVSEPKTLEGMIKDLSAEKPLNKPIIVLDAGIATEANIKWLKGNQYFYLVVSRKKKKNIPENVNLITVKKDDNTFVQAALVKNEETDEIELYCHSKGKEKKEQGIKSLFQQRLEEELIKAHSALSKKNGTKRYEKVIEKIGRLKERFKRVAHCYEVIVEKDPETNKAKAINWHLKETENNNGLYVLRTNRADLTEEQIWNIYNTLTDIEDAFRCMKSELGLRPIHHQTELRTDGHIFITVLAYHLLHSIRFKLKCQGIHLSFSTIRDRLSTQVRITTTMKRKDGKMIHIRKSSLAELFHKKIYDALNLRYQPGKTVKTIL